MNGERCPAFAKRKNAHGDARQSIAVVLQGGGGIAASSEGLAPSPLLLLLSFHAFIDHMAGLAFRAFDREWRLQQHP